MLPYMCLPILVIPSHVTCDNHHRITCLLPHVVVTPVAARVIAKRLGIASQGRRTAPVARVLLGWWSSGAWLVFLPGRFTRNKPPPQVSCTHAVGHRSCTGCVCFPCRPVLQGLHAETQRRDQAFGGVNLRSDGLQPTSHECRTPHGPCRTNSAPRGPCRSLLVHLFREALHRLLLRKQDLGAGAFREMHQGLLPHKMRPGSTT